MTTIGFEILKEEAKKEKETGYIWSLWSGKLRVYKGFIHRHPMHGWTRFISETKSWQCASEPGVVYGATVWFRELDIKKAKDALREYHIREMKKLNEKVENHFNKVKIIDSANMLNEVRKILELEGE